MSQYLFLFTIGPVQSFIAQARKTQDLYAGSKLLSDLIGEAILHVGESNIIFPSQNIQSKPNRLVAKIQSDDINSLGKSVQSKVEQKFLEIAKESYKNEFGDTEFSSVYEKQIKSFLQIYWSASIIQNYLEDYNSLETHLGAVKNYRNFEQLEESGRKCSLCGERNVLVFRKVEKKESKDKYPKEAKEIKNFSYLFNPGEGLCGVCFTKRVYKYKKNFSFDSTADVAIANLISFLKQDEVGKKLYSEYRNCFNDNNFDGQLFFEENLNLKYFEKQELGDVPIRNLNFNIPKAYEKIKDYLKNNNLKFNPYYAVIAFDGDSMGKQLSGEQLKDRSKLETYHENLSKALGEFSTGVKKYLDTNEDLGQAIYAGGDDFLGLLNLANLFKILKKINELFEETVNTKLKESDNVKEKLSFSAGIAIAHYKTPLSETLNWARSMEKEAKTVTGKNAYSIAVLKHSGEISYFKMKWKLSDEFDTISFLEEITNLLGKNVFSSTFMKNLYNEFYRLIDKNPKSEGKNLIDDKLIETEIKRLLYRSFIPNEDSNKKYPKLKNGEREIVESLSEKMMQLFTKKVSLDNYFSMLHVIDFMQRRIY
jgi:CRISPR-associated protein Cmr2